MFIHLRKICKSTWLNFHSKICYFQQFQQHISSPTPQKKQRNFHVANLLVSCYSVGPRFVHQIGHVPRSVPIFPMFSTAGFRCKEPLAKPMFVSCQTSKKNKRIRTPKIRSSPKLVVSLGRRAPDPSRWDQGKRGNVVVSPKNYSLRTMFFVHPPGKLTWLRWKINMFNLKNTSFMFHFPC